MHRIKKTVSSQLLHWLRFAAWSIGLFILLQAGLLWAAANDWYDARYFTTPGYHELTSDLMSAAWTMGVVSALYAGAQVWIAAKYSKSVPRVARRPGLIAVAAIALVLGLCYSNNTMTAIRKEAPHNYLLRRSANQP